MKNIYLIVVLLVMCWACSKNENLQSNTKDLARVGVKNLKIDTLLYRRFIKDDEFLKICEMYNNSSSLLTKSDTEIKKLIRQYGEANECENLEDYIEQYNIDYAPNVLSQWNMLIAQADLREEQLLLIYQNHDTIVSKGDLQEKIRNYLRVKEPSIGALYKDFRITKYYFGGCRIPFESNEKVIEYFRNCGVPEPLFKYVCSEISSAYTSMKTIIEDELSKVVVKPDTVRPPHPGGSEDEKLEVKDLTVEEAVRATNRYFTWGNNVYPDFFIPDFDGQWINNSYNHWGNLDLYTYNDFACFNETKEDKFQVFYKMSLYDDTYTLLGLRVNNEKSYSFYLLLVGNYFTPAYGCLETGLCYKKNDQEKYLMKIFYTTSNQKIIVRRLVTNSSLSFEDSFDSIRGQIIETRYTLDRTGFNQEEEIVFPEKDYDSISIQHVFNNIQ